MKIARALLLIAAGLSGPAFAAPAPAPAPAVNVDDFGCMVRSMYMAGAAEQAAQKATDQAGRDSATKIASENYEAASFFIGKLSAGKPVANMQQRFEGEVAGLAKLDSGVLADQIAKCVGRAQAERAAFVNPLTTK